MNALFAFLIGTGIGVALAYLVAVRMRPKPTTNDVARFMSSVVSREEAEEQRRANKLQLVRSGTRTMRSDGGPSAKVYRMRKRRTIVHTPIDRT